MTSRTRKMAQPGCYFIAFGQDFRVDFVDKMRLYDVAYGFYDKEGVDSPEAFIELWKKIHPRKGFDPDWPVWAIQFHKFTIKPDEPREKP